MALGDAAGRAAAGLPPPAGRARAQPGPWHPSRPAGAARSRASRSAPRGTRSAGAAAAGSAPRQRYSKVPKLWQRGVAPGQDACRSRRWKGVEVGS